MVCYKPHGGVTLCERCRPSPIAAESPANLTFASAMGEGRSLDGDRAVDGTIKPDIPPEAAAATTHAGLQGSPRQGLVMGTWGSFVGFSGVGLYRRTAKYFQDQMHLGRLAHGALMASVTINLTAPTAMDAAS